MRTKIAVLLLAGAVVTAGCGSSAPKSASVATSAVSAGASAKTTVASAAVATTAAANPTSTTAGAATAVGGGDATIAEAGSSVDTKPVDTKPVDTNFTGAGSAAFCGLARDLDKSGGLSGGLDSGDPNTLKAQYTKFLGIIKDITAKAPSEIKGDFQISLKAFAAVGDAYAKYDWDIKKLSAAMATDTSLATTLTSSDMDSATTRIDAYLAKVCGIASGSDSTDGSTTTG